MLVAGKAGSHFVNCR